MSKLIDTVCQDCFIELKRVHHNTKRCSECNFAKKIEYQRKYQEENKEKIKAHYNQNKDKYNESKKKYRQSEKGRAAIKRYNDSERGKESREKYWEKLKQEDPVKYEEMRKKQKLNRKEDHKQSYYKDLMRRGYTFN